MNTLQASCSHEKATRHGPNDTYLWECDDCGTRMQMRIITCGEEGCEEQVGRGFVPKSTLYCTKHDPFISIQYKQVAALKEGE